MVRVCGEFVLILVRVDGGGVVCISQFMVMESLEMGVHDACVWGLMIIAPCGAGKCWSRIVRIGIDNGNVAFVVFASKFRNEGEVTGAI